MRSRDEDSLEAKSLFQPKLTWEQEIQEEDRMLLRRQEDFRAAAAYVAVAFARLPVVERVVLFGSVAQPLRREIPRFR